MDGDGDRLVDSVSVRPGRPVLCDSCGKPGTDLRIRDDGVPLQPSNRIIEKRPCGLDIGFHDAQLHMRQHHCQWHERSTAGRRANPGRSGGFEIQHRLHEPGTKVR